MSKQLKPSVCIDAVFEGRPVEEACAAVAEAGISAVEFWGWWDRDLDGLKAAVKERELEISSCCTKFISLVDPELRESYVQGVRDSVEAARALGTETLISQVGDYREGVSRDAQRASLVAGLKEVVPILEAGDVTLVIEPLNVLVDHAGYFLVNSGEAFDIVKAVGSQHVKVVFDIYHQQISEGHLIKNITGNIDWIGHFHAAGNPGRNELQKGEINYPEIFRAIQSTSYEGYVGLEYWPSSEDVVSGLLEVASWL